MNDEQKALNTTIRAIASTEPVKKAKKKIENKLMKEAELKLKQLGVSKRDAEIAAAALKIVTDKRISLKKNIGKNTSISGTADWGNNSISLNVNHSF